MDLQFHTLDVFTSTRLEGNPLAVVSVPAALKGKLSQATKAKIAQEFHLSETVFLHEGEGDGDGDDATSTERHINIFTVGGEIPFAGHPTIGTSVLVKYHLGLPSVDTLVAKCGPIGIEAGPGQYIRARIPHDVRVHARTLADVVTDPDYHPGLSAAPVVREAELKAPVVSIVNGVAFVLVKLPSLKALGAVNKEWLDFASLDTPLLDEGWRESFVGRYYYVDVGGGDFESGVKKRRLRTRMVEVGFEDPATGSAASALCSYLTLAEEKRGTKFEVTQGVEMGRRSVIHVETTVKQGQDEDELKLDDVFLGGTAVVIMKGSLKVDPL